MTSITDNGEVEFEFFRAGARSVLLCGDFTNWQDQPVAMQSTGRGWWKVTAKLDGGEYRFRYRVDGQWFTDYAAYGVEATDEGINSVLVVPHPRCGVRKTSMAPLAA